MPVRHVGVRFRGIAAHLLTVPFVLLKVVGMAVHAYRRPSEPIAAEPTDLRQIDQAILVIRKADEAEALAACKAVLAFQQAHPEALYYTRTRIYLAPYLAADGAVDSSRKLVTFLDEYDNYPAYFASLLFGPFRKPAALRFQLGMFRHVQILDAKTKLGHTTWTEQQDLRVEITSCEALYPRVDDGDTVVQAEQRVWAVASRDLAATVDGLAGVLAYQKENADRFYFSRARAFTAAYPGHSAKAMVMAFYETDDHARFSESFAEAAKSDGVYQALTGQVEQNVLDNEKTGVTTWTEQPDLRVRFKFREPLYPYAGEPVGGQNVPPMHTPSPQRASAFDVALAGLRTVAMWSDNFVAALQTQDQNVISRSMRPGAR